MHRKQFRFSLCLTAAVLPGLCNVVSAENPLELDASKNAPYQANLKNAQYLSRLGSQIKDQVTRVRARKPEWQPVDKAPADFPVPLYNGSGTEFQPVNFDLPAQSGSAHFITLRTQGSPREVGEWYKQHLTAFNLQPDVRAPRSSVECRVIRASSRSLDCAVVVSPFPGAADKTLVQITAVPGARQ